MKKSLEYTDVLTEAILFFAKSLSCAILFDEFVGNESKPCESCWSNTVV